MTKFSPAPLSEFSFGLELDGDTAASTVASVASSYFNVTPSRLMK